jgi:preprotein translocase subunit SecE
MAKEKTLVSSAPASSSSSGGGSWLAEFFHAGLYKPTQGKIVRQATFFAMAGLTLWACYQLMNWLGAVWEVAQYPLPLALAMVGLWGCYRAVNVPRFADFLIAVQAEMNKVSWPSQKELVRSSLVVIIVIFLLAMLMFGFDLIWMALFKWIGILKE